MFKNGSKKEYIEKYYWACMNNEFKHAKYYYSELLYHYDKKYGQTFGKIYLDEKIAKYMDKLDIKYGLKSKQ